MESCDHLDLTATSIRPALLGRQFSLGLRQLASGLGAKELADNQLAVARGDEVRDP
jgi:hypothetical protein